MFLSDYRVTKARLEAARARLEKSFTRSPIDGIVIHKYMKAGESASVIRDRPVITVADTTILRARVDVDETDAGRIREGQSAYVTADAYGDRRFSGRVVQIGQALGRKNIRTDEPVERVDTKILETLNEFDSALPVGLRVDAFILTGEAAQRVKAVDLLTVCSQASGSSQQFQPIFDDGNNYRLKGVCHEKSNRFTLHSNAYGIRVCHRSARRRAGGKAFGHHQPRYDYWRTGDFQRQLHSEIQRKRGRRTCPSERQQGSCEGQLQNDQDYKSSVRESGRLQPVI